MTQAELDRQIARATGESVKTIAERGFVPLNAVEVLGPFWWLAGGVSKSHFAMPAGCVCIILNSKHEI